MAYTVNQPVRFPGTPEEIAANLATHNFVASFYGEDDFDERCWDCDCKPWYISATWPCGTRDIPREDVTYGD
jgi:hypothetical protein